MPASRFDVDFLHQKDWDCIVIGAGPAGSAAAIQLGRRGHSVLLLDKKRFPRSKVCGGCLSGRAVQELRRLNLDHVLDGAISLKSFVLGTPGQQVRLDCRGGVAISRSTLDQRLADQARLQNVAFVSEAAATLGPATPTHRRVDIRCRGQNHSCRAKVVLVCTGLSIADPKRSIPLEEQVDSRSRIGLTTISCSSEQFDPGTIYMSVDRDGYLGVTVLENSQLNLSACARPEAIRSSGSPQAYARKMLEQLGMKPPRQLEDSPWMGSPRLTRQLKVPGGERVFVLGDAASYIEPFTGEGISWALESSVHVQRFAENAIRTWDSSLILSWKRELADLLRRRQRICYAMKVFANRPKIVALAIPVLRKMPWLAKPVIAGIHGSS